MVIKVLCENTAAKDGMSTEHGLSLYIETLGKKILFDVGTTDVFLKNANPLEVDLSKVDFAVISHGHYDHGGGLNHFLEVNDHAPIYINKHAFKRYYHDRDIGLDISLEKNPRIVLTGDNFDICDEIKLYTNNEKSSKYPVESYDLGVIENGEFVSDKFIHEQYMSVYENGKHILISGCSHKGVLNIMDWSKDDIPQIFIGGFHFYVVDTASPVLKKSAEELLEYDTQFYTCHCTGVPQYEVLKDIMADKIGYLASGMEIEI